MMEIIIGCIIANVITIALIGCGVYILYRKNEDKIKQLLSEISAIVKQIKSIDVTEIKNSIDKITLTIDSIKEKLDNIKWPF